MKIQDIGFIIVFITLLIIRKPTMLVIVGLSCLILAMPLFYFRVFFTAERLTWYAAAFFLTHLIILISKEIKS